VGEVAVPGDLTQADDDLDPGQEGDFVGEVRRTGANLFGGGLVAGRSAVDDGADPDAAEAEAILKVCGVGLVGEAGVMKDRIEEVAGAVAGEDAAGTVAAVGSRSEAEGQDASPGSPKPGTGRAQ
jgi:hypothetical protein